jgi:hypothetical protein
LADLAPRSSDVENLRRQAEKLTSTALSLISVFTEEASRLNRNDEASRLKALYSSINYQVDQMKHSEDVAESGHIRADMISALGGLALGGIVKQVSKNKQLATLTDNLFNSHPAKEPPFGKVLVCVGPKGLPEDVEIVCISRLARKSNREESDIIKELQEHGFLLFTERTFSSLIDKLVNDIQKGRRHLPVSMKELTEIKAAGTSELVSDNNDERAYLYRHRRKAQKRLILA